MVTNDANDIRSIGHRFLLVKEVASLAGVSSMTVYRMIRERQFPAVHVRSRWIVPAGAVTELVALPTPPDFLLGPGFLDVPMVARVLRVSAATLYRLIQDGGFPAVWLRGRVLVPSHVVDEMAAAAITARAAIDPQDWVTSPADGAWPPTRAVAAAAWE